MTPVSIGVELPIAASESATEDFAIILYIILWDTPVVLQLAEIDFVPVIIVPAAFARSSALVRLFSAACVTKLSHSFS